AGGAEPRAPLSSAPRGLPLGDPGGPVRRAVLGRTLRFVAGRRRGCEHVERAPELAAASSDGIGGALEIRVDANQSKSNPMSAAGAECVSAPIEMASTPARESSAIRARVMPPEASSVARPEV